MYELELICHCQPSRQNKTRLRPMFEIQIPSKYWKWFSVIAQWSCRENLYTFKKQSIMKSKQ